jgi:hypothetical protein
MGLSSQRDPAERYATYTKSDTVAFAGGNSRQILVLDEGAVVLWKPDDSTVTTPTLPAGTVLNVVAKGIKETSTVATLFFVLH